MNNIAIYIHWPFCKSKCPYCDFNSHVRDSIDVNTFEKAYLNEIDYFADYLKDKNIASIFFGGGTPSLMPVNLVEKILNHLHKKASLNKNCEITLEANPTSSEAKNFKLLKQIGVNRLSVGIQSLRDKYLKFLGREHSVQEALNVLEIIATIFDNYSFDLIYTLPEQDIKTWLEDLELALTFTNTHISLYQLTIEKGTVFYKDYKNKKFHLPNEEISSAIYNITCDYLEKRGFKNYEISNFAKPGFESQHNLAYWKYLPYLGLGAGAHSRLHYQDDKIEAIMMKHSPENWLKSISLKQNAIQTREFLTEKAIAEEKLLMGLRLAEGISNKKISKFLNYKKLDECVKNGFLNFHNNNLSITKKGKSVLNSIIAEILC